INSVIPSTDLHINNHYPHFHQAGGNRNRIEGMVMFQATKDSRAVAVPSSAATPTRTGPTGIRSDYIFDFDATQVKIEHLLRHHAASGPGGLFAAAAVNSTSFLIFSALSAADAWSHNASTCSMPGIGPSGTATLRAAGLSGSASGTILLGAVT